MVKIKKYFNLDKNHNVVIVLLSLGVLCFVIALFNMPKEYYNVLRIIISFISLYVIFTYSTYSILFFFNKYYRPFTNSKYSHYKHKLALIPFIIILILFNPISEIYLYERLLWFFIDYFGIGLFLYSIKKENEIKEDVFCDAIKMIPTWLIIGSAEDEHGYLLGNEAFSLAEYRRKQFLKENYQYERGEGGMSICSANYILL